MSALVQKRTKCCNAANVRYVPLGDIPTNSNGASKAPFTLQERCDYTRYGANDAT